MVTHEKMQLEALRIWLGHRRDLPMAVRVALEGISSGRPDIWATIPEVAKLGDFDRAGWAAGVFEAAEAMRDAATSLGAPVPAAVTAVLGREVPK
jgi:hypothetical protein